METLDASRATRPPLARDPGALVLVVTAVLVLTVSSTTVWAQKTDKITLLNGDHFTGEVKRLDRGRLEVSTDDAGTIDIEWDKVASVLVNREFEVITSDGRRLLGTLGPTADRVVLVEGADGGEAIPMPEITGMAPIGASFWTRLDGSVDVGFTYTRSSGVTQGTLNTSTLFVQPKFVVRLTTSATLTKKQDQGGRDDRAALDLSYVRYRGRRLFVAGAARLENNESLGLTLRSQLGGVVGLRPVTTNRGHVEVGAGLAVNEERGVDTAPTTNIEGVVILRTAYYTYDRPQTTIDASVQYYPSLNTSGRHRLQVDASAKRELWKDFFVALNLFNTFDSEPPNETAARNDVGVVASLGWSF